MFRSCKSLVNTNGSISGWQTSNVTNMNSMFDSAISFNQPLNWDTQNVTDMSYIFNRATSFNQDISGWNTAKVTNMTAMFLRATSFNQPLDNWNTSNVTIMEFMFDGATAFNKPLNSWNTAKVANMQAMFRGATSFNQPLNNWSTANVTTMNSMFDGATSFNQPVGSFRINAIIYDMYLILRGCGMDCENLSSTLDSWKTQAAILNKNNIALDDISGLYYNQTGQAAIAALKARGWTITGGTYATDYLTPKSWFTTV